MKKFTREAKKYAKVAVIAAAVVGVISFILKRVYASLAPNSEENFEQEFDEAFADVPVEDKE